MKKFIIGMVITALLSPSMAFAKPHKHHHKKHHKDVIIVKPKHHRHHHHHRDVVIVKPGRPYYKPWYYRSSLPEIATFAVIAGVTYAIVDNMYYKRDGDRYIKVMRP
ncbi:TPA: hypothetical protein ACX6QT_002386 [Photobacterium damselae]|uniref:Ni/Co efflux regulator RcnB n=1 Tax=Photobacterium damsela subsp. piscicida TaxID=38294 RepID=A0A1V1VFD2_PHODP|nr:hypothetical protein [Photobacterium damselae]MBE8126808.1 hypothetical protein [Photobacterium damselae subsp. piscicida]MCG3846781.1 hypothetical protein [Photobacterium damselae]MCG9780183.1 tocopherol cyclase family protein [Photobacterium damselae]MDP2533962.1 hypothetical protein [Photobacterium damselae subsp. piscicida]MDP2544269.1 hypothetical protein [Photobacterium damselae subsp. piscicida]